MRTVYLTAIMLRYLVLINEPGEVTSRRRFQQLLYYTTTSSMKETPGMPAQRHLATSLLIADFSFVTYKSRLDEMPNPEAIRKASCCKQPYRTGRRTKSSALPVGGV